MSLEDFLMVEISKDGRFENMFARKFAKKWRNPNCNRSFWRVPTCLTNIYFNLPTKLCRRTEWKHHGMYFSLPVTCIIIVNPFHTFHKPSAKQNKCVVSGPKQIVLFIALDYSHCHLIDNAKHVVVSWYITHKPYIYIDVYVYIYIYIYIHHDISPIHHRYIMIYHP